MSTKIYNGYKLPQKTYKDVQTAVSGLREPIKTTAKALAARLASQEATQIIDRHATGMASQEDTGGSARSITAKRLNARAKLVQNTRDPEIDLEFKITLHNHGDEYYAMVFAEQKNLTNLWAFAMGATEFNFWDNTDAPDNLTPDDWAARERIWEDILDGQPPAYRGATIEFDTGRNNFNLSADHLFGFKPTFDARVKTIAIQKRITLSMKDTIANSPLQSFSPISKAISQAAVEMNDIDAYPDMKAICLDIRSSLKEHLGPDDYLAPYASRKDGT